jgi:hypothetical protein
MPEHRKRVWLDRFQTQLSVRVSLYFIIYQVAVWALVYFERVIHNASETMMKPGLTVFGTLFPPVCALCLCILFVFDVVKHAHRVAGPLYQIRKTVRALKAGEPVNLVRFCKNDLLPELQDEFNDMLKALEERGAIVLETGNANHDRQAPVSV